jgi:hypothetical protein
VGAVVSRRAYAKLSPRDEQRILDLRADGLIFDVIASRIGCSKGTVWNTLNARAEVPTDRIPSRDCTTALVKVQALIKKTRGTRL